jgi:hypothetical protein
MELNEAIEVGSTMADATEALYSMESDAREIADRILALAKRMEEKGLPAILLLPAMSDICTVGKAFGSAGDFGLAATLASLQDIIEVKVKN